MLGLAQRAGKLVSGDETCEITIKSNKCCLVIVSLDASEKTKKKFKDMCSNLHITTDDGTLGSRGVTLDLLPALLQSGQFDMIYTCGPHVMMDGVARLAKEYNIPCQVSLEEYMACGVGGCLSCTCATKDGSRKKVCTDGPVFWAEEVTSC